MSDISLRQLARWPLVVLAALTLSIGFMTAPATSASTANQRIATVNFCGVACQNGSTSNTASLVSQFSTFKPQAVLLSEVCYSQLQDILTKSQATVWPLYAKFTYVRTQSACGTNTQFGNAILSSTNSFTNYAEKVLTTGKIQKVSCAQLSSFAYATVVCNTHTTPDDTPSGTIADQIKAAKNFALNHASGKPLVFGGDLNRTPDTAALNPVYYQGKDKNGNPSTGNFHEVDQCAAPNQRNPNGHPGCNGYTKKDQQTGALLPRKIDYVFLKQAYFKNFDGSTANVAGSDHLMVKGTATICNTATC